MSRMQEFARSGFRELVPSPNQISATLKIDHDVAAFLVEFETIGANPNLRGRSEPDGQPTSGGVARARSQV